jgi:chromosome segregation ATPase
MTEKKKQLSATKRLNERFTKLETRLVGLSEYQESVGWDITRLKGEIEALEPYRRFIIETFHEFTKRITKLESEKDTLSTAAQMYEEAVKRLEKMSPWEREVRIALLDQLMTGYKLGLRANLRAKQKAETT